MKAPLSIEDSPGKIALWLIAAWYPVLSIAAPAEFQKYTFLATLGISLAVLLASTASDFAIWGIPSWGFFLGNWVTGLVAIASFERLPKGTIYLYIALLSLALPALLWQMYRHRKRVPVDTWIILILFLTAVAASELAMVPPRVLSKTALLGMLFFASLEMFAVSVGMLHAASRGARSAAIASMAEFFIAVIMLEPDYRPPNPHSEAILTAIELLPVIVIPAIVYFCRSDERTAWLSWGISLLAIAAAAVFGMVNRGLDPNMVERLILVALPCVFASLLAVRLYPVLRTPSPGGE